MAHSVPSFPVLHCKAEDFLKNSILGLRVLNFGMYAHTEVFGVLPVDISLFEPAVLLLDRMITDPKYKSKEKIAQSKLVHKYLAWNIQRAKLVCGNKIELIELSGFNVNRPPVKLPVPDEPLISCIRSSKEAGFYEVVIKRKSNKKLVEQAPKTHLRNVLFKAQLTLTPDEPESWITVCYGATRYNIKIKRSDAIQGHKNYLRLCGSNSAGTGNYCHPYPFTPEWD